MKTLSKFMANYIANQTVFNPNRLEEMFCEAIEAYKKHLQNDHPKTVQWVMIEKQLISALEKMESRNHLEHYKICACPEYRMHKGCEDCPCKSICDAKESESDLGKVKHPICPLNMYFEGDEDECNTDKCNFENRSCTEACKLKTEEEN